MKELMILEVNVFSEQGAVRSENQDAVYAARKEQAGIFAVADGMGGQHKGGIASSLAAAGLKDWWKQIQDSIMALPFLEVVSSLEKAIYSVNRQIYQAYQQERQQGGTTLCAFIVQGTSYGILNIGDSRIYYYDGKKSRQLSVDDVWENQPDIRALSDTVDLRRDPRYGRLTNALGAWEQVSVSVATGSIEKKGVFFLCSDGVYKYCNRKRIETMMQRAGRSRNTGKLLEGLKKEIYRNGAEDNLSGVLVKIKG